MTIGNYTLGLGALIALVTGILVAVLLLVDEWNADRAGVAIIALAAARLIP